MSKRIVIALVGAVVVRAVAFWYFPWPEWNPFLVQVGAEQPYAVEALRVSYELLWFTTPALLIWYMLGDIKKKYVHP